MAVRQYVTPHRARGFTLLELLVAIAIIGVLAGLMSVIASEYRKSAKNARTTAVAREVMTALMLYYDDHGNFPCHTYEETPNNPDFLEPLVTGEYINDGAFRGHTLPFAYVSFRDAATGRCGAYAMLGFLVEGDSPDDIVCPFGVGHAHLYQGHPHCHNMLPRPLPSPPCADAYWVSGTCAQFPPDGVNSY